MILIEDMGVDMAIKIYIDQGHNPSSPNAGAEGNGYVEQDITYDVGIILSDLLRANGNFDVRVSRPTPETSLGTSNSSSLRIRVDEANAFGADYFVSLHANASSNPSVSGSEVLVYNEPSVASELGEDILLWMNRITGLKNRGIVERPGLYVLRKTQMPAVLVEMGFISNLGDASLMNNSPGLFAEGIYNGILQYTGLL
jgi:N-acetylmuramoyl-L-alanine amidase